MIKNKEECVPNEKKKIVHKLVFWKETIAELYEKPMKGVSG